MKITYKIKKIDFKKIKYKRYKAKHQNKPSRMSFNLLFCKRASKKYSGELIAKKLWDDGIAWVSKVSQTPNVDQKTNFVIIEIGGWLKMDMKLFDTVRNLRYIKLYRGFEVYVVRNIGGLEIQWSQHFPISYYYPEKHDSNYEIVMVEEELPEDILQREELLKEERQLREILQENLLTPSSEEASEYKPKPFLFGSIEELWDEDMRLNRAQNEFEFDCLYI